MAHILIAVPTNKYIEAETVKSITSLRVPEGCTIQFEYFYGYQIDQIRNLIADWMVRGPFDYLFSVDSDMIIPIDALQKLYAADKDIITGVYVQRKDDVILPEIYVDGLHGSQQRIDVENLRTPQLREIAGCGFGCVLIKKHVFTRMSYPHFVYRSALTMEGTFSEDAYFCQEARKVGCSIWVDTSIRCGHKGTYIFHPDRQTPETRLRYLNKQRLLPSAHREYLSHLTNKIAPAVIYDIGACVLHWTQEAQLVFPQSQFFVFDAVENAAFLYKEAGLPHHIGVLGESFRPVKWYENELHPGGNSIYRENPKITPLADTYFPVDQYKWRVMQSLDSVVLERGFPPPNLLKIDVQGAELDVLQGALDTIKNCDDIILELQHMEYNLGAPGVEVVTKYLERHGYRLEHVITKTNVDGDYHFTRRSAQ
jgi:FkbM family methyltransferase